ncbi:Hypothetical protein, putative [Bodo saltans]|uniref:DNA polymerase delta subunit 3 n=1 Tax=Bodo saltans TaxID=75058 RepID=A0A0S4KIU1_BODSA|nr:Hypothetical protein, putative [Bodo saltans]|eukprot:CUI15620.1 Hypothetical protein, putative [Bodo saltans]
MATELLYSWIRGGRSTVTARELSRASGITMSLVEAAMLSEAESNGSAWDVQFTVSFTSDTVGIGIKRFHSQRDAQAFASEASDRKVQLHSVSVKDNSRTAPLSMSELITQRFGDISLQRSGSLRVAQESYPLLSRQATIEKSMSSGDLPPQTLAVKSATTQPVPPVPPKTLPAAAAAKVTPAVPTVTSVVTIAKPITPSVAHVVQTGNSPIKQTAQTILSEATATTTAASVSAVNEEEPLLSIAPVAAPSSNTLAKEEQPSITSPPVKAVVDPPKAVDRAENVVAPQPQGGKVQKSLFDMMKPVKRSRDDGAVDTVVAAPPKPAPSKKAPASAPAKAPKAKPLKETKSLAKLASRNGNKDDAPVPSSSLVLDAEEQDDSDAEREEDDHDKYLAQVLQTPPRPKGNVKASKIDLSNVILPCGDDEDILLFPSAGDDDCVLGDAATLIRQPTTVPTVPAAVSPKPQSPSPGRFAPTTIAPQKRPREAAEAVPIITGNLDSFFNTKLFAFQQMYTHEHKSECAVVNGEYIFNEVTFYQHKESKDTLTEEQYQTKQRQLIAKFEEERAAKKKLQQQESQPTADEAPQPSSTPNVKLASKEGTTVTKTALSKAAKAATAASAQTGPKQTTLFSFMKKN